MPLQFDKVNKLPNFGNLTSFLFWKPVFRKEGVIKFCQRGGSQVALRFRGKRSVVVWPWDGPLLGKSQSFCRIDIHPFR
jgi:hypothetical protein